MAHVVVTREEAEGEGKLPAACMCCGAPAAAWVTRRLMLKPPQHGRFELAEVALIRSVHALATSPYVSLRTSFCEQHRHYWTVRMAVLFGGMGVFFAAMLLALVLGVAASAINPAQPHKGLVAVAVMSALFGLVGWLVPLLILWRNPIRAVGLDNGLVVVDNVGDAYAAAVQATRPQAIPLPAQKENRR
jgi:hypothetical protein